MKEGTRQMKRAGFTIVELLTVMSVIAILIGLLVPALAMVRDFANQIQQGAQFHSIEVGLDMYKTEFGEYPESNDNSMNTFSSPQHPIDSTPYTGANKMAEALVGMDFLGVHPATDFRSSGRADVQDRDGIIQTNVLLYRDAAVNGIVNTETAEENIKKRSGGMGAPFIDLENANAFRMEDVYDSTDLTAIGFVLDNGSDLIGSPVLCDVYAKKRPSVTRAKTGMPILYFRARTQFTQQDYQNPAMSPTQPGAEEDDVYYYYDNENLLALGSAESTPVDHPLSDGVDDLRDFEDMLVNKQILMASGTAMMKRPYRASSYILISAGKDGLYGTADDITNFKKNDEQ